MDPHELIKIAARKIAHYIIEEKYNYVDYPILAQLACNYIFHLVKEVRTRVNNQKCARIDAVLLKILRLTEVDLNDQFFSNIIMKDLELIKTQHLYSLGLGDASDIPNYNFEKDARLMRRVRRAEVMNADEYSGCDPTLTPWYCDIAKLLEENLTPETKQSLLALDLSKYIRSRAENPFLKNWTRSIGQMLPSLYSLKVIGQNLEGDEFFKLCENFPNLRILNISKTGVTNLRGISNLEFLEDLSIGALVMANQNCIHELFELPNLKKLSMSEQYACNCCKFNTIKFFAESDKVIQRLELFDCTLTKTTDAWLERIVERHPTLRRVVANYSSVQNYRRNGVEILNNLNLHSFLCSIRYFREVRNTGMVLRILYPFLDYIYMTDIRNLNEGDMRATVQELYSLTQQYDYHNNMLEHVDVFCANMAEENKLHFYSLFEKRLLIESFLIIKEVSTRRRLNIDPSWKFLNMVLETVEQCDADRIASIAMKNLIAKTNNRLHHTLDCIQTIHLVLGRIDPTAHHYEGMDITSLKSMLRKMLTDRKGTRADRGRIRRVLNFIRNSFR